MSERVSALTGRRLFWPVTALVVLLLANLLFTPDFFKIELRGGHLYGSLVDIVRLGAPLIMVALGMTLVIATKGIDLSVGSIVAICGALACLWISRQDDQTASAESWARSAWRSGWHWYSACGTASWSRGSACNRSSRR